MLLPALQALQKRIGWISPGALNYVSTRLTVPPAEAFGVASFYAMLSLEPQPPLVAYVCDDIACSAAGAAGVCASMEAGFGPEGSAGIDGRSTWRRSPCLGQCDRAPAVLFQVVEAEDAVLAPATAEATVAVLTGGAELPEPPDPQLPQAGGDGLTLLRRVGVVDPGSLDDYRTEGGYEALRRALAVGPDQVIREAEHSKLLGRGGAAFPTGTKWRAVAHAPERPHFVVCNADESEPGTFKDRIVMEQDPFAVVESITIAGYAVSAEKGYIYVRGEYPLAAARLETAIAKARQRGLLGDDVMGSGFGFDIEIRRGAGAYICGEETALFNSIEGLRGEPRNKPPFPATRGLFGKPTAINNVETLVNMLDVLRAGASGFLRVGTEDSTGHKLLCLSGCVEHPGLYEVAFGTTLRALLDMAGGVRGGRGLRAVLLGGAAGSFVTAEDLDVPLTFEGTRAVDASLGSGVVMVFDDSISMEDIVLRIASFFRAESCGQCVPCRVGTVRQEEVLRRLATSPKTSDLALLGDLKTVMKEASICGLGQTAANAVTSAIDRLGLFEVRG